MHILKHLKQNIDKYRLIQPGDVLLVGVSGGPDSVALLHLLYKLRYALGIKLHVAHINHHLRPSAAKDQKFVEDLCRKKNIPYTIAGVHINRNSPGSLEEKARNQRLKKLAAIAQAVNANKIVLAHHQDDLAETVLMRIIRGSGLLGLQGILPIKQLHGQTVIRPLLSATKGDILKYLKDNKLSFCTDPTNQERSFLRNRIRLELLPELKKNYNANISATLANLSQNIVADYDYLNFQARKIFKRLVSPRSKTKLLISLTAFSRLHTAMQRMVLRTGILLLQGDLKRITTVHFQEIEDLLANRPTGSLVHLPQGISLKKEKNFLALSLRKA